jgi:hypothetical protein
MKNIFLFIMLLGYYFLQAQTLSLDPPVSKALKCDTAKYALASPGGGGGSTDTTSLSHRIDLKLDIDDTTNKWQTKGTYLKTESDPVWIADSNKYYTKIWSAAKYQPKGTYISAESDPLWKSDTTNYQRWTDTTANGKSATKSWVHSQGYLKTVTETDPLWKADTSSYLRWSDTIQPGRIVTKKQQGIFYDKVEFKSHTHPPTITANVNDYNPVGLSYVSRLDLTSDANRNITGLVSSGIADGRMILITNVNTANDNIVLVDNSASSTDVNRFYFSTNITLARYESVVIYYNTAYNRWLAFNHY